MFLIDQQKAVDKHKVVGWSGKAGRLVMNLFYDVLWLYSAART